MHITVDKAEQKVSNNRDEAIRCISGIKQRARLWMIISLILSDLVAIALAGLCAILARPLLGQSWHFGLFAQALPVALFVLIFFSLRGLYPAIGLGPVIELRRLTLTTSAVALGLAGLTFFARNPEDYSRLTLGLTWFFSLGLLPLARATTRAVVAHFGYWGEAVAVIGYGEQGQRLALFLRRDRKIGLDPVVVLDGFGKRNPRFEDLPILAAETVLSDPNLLPSLGLQTAVLLSSDVPADLVEKISRLNKGGFRRLIIIPDLEGVSSLGLEVVDLGGITGFELRNNLMGKWGQTLKRLMDITLVALGGLLISPLLALVALLIRLDSKGNTLYGHIRVGKGERKFKMWKFRTMVQNADQILGEYLQKHPELQTEWEADHKLKHDPRITRVGEILRKYSLDELPQIWNVFRGEMSLVGPRPIVDDECRKYAESFEFYKQVKPGITGLWQVSGRNNLSYEERVHLDEYYVRNWSLWLDIYILAKTFWVVISREGAY